MTSPSTTTSASATDQSSSVILPVKRIISPQSLDLFISSSTHADIVDFITELNEACTGVKTRAECAQSPVITALLDILHTARQLAKDTPPVDNEKSRFGNPAFKTFYDKINAQSASLHQRIPGLHQQYIPELCVYFNESWGNRERIDYGSGMELNFLCWLLALKKLGLIQKEDHTALVIRVFSTYLDDMRQLQETYWLEPAGSHGVWGLDDYAFLPFLFGAAQLKGHKHIRPKSIHNPEILEEFSKDYLYLACIRFINSIKTASLRWHSPMLDDISAVKTWDKINEGLFKMYKAEVLAKLPVAQHIFFGSLLPFPVSQEEQEAAEQPSATDEHGHIHVKGEMWGDCCGIKVPAAFGEAQAKAETGQMRAPMSNRVARVPFD